MSSSSPSPSPPTSSSPGDAAADPAAPAPETPETAIDLAGEVCPFTFVRAKLALEALPIGAALRVVVDHEPAIRTIPRSAREWGQEILGVHALGPGRWAIDLRRRVR